MDEVTQLKKIIENLSNKLANANIQLAAAESAADTWQAENEELSARLTNQEEVHNITTKED